jgi:hypothetical protein
MLHKGEQDFSFPVLIHLLAIYLASTSFNLFLALAFKLLNPPETDWISRLIDLKSLIPKDENFCHKYVYISKWQNSSCSFSFSQK